MDTSQEQTIQIGKDNGEPPDSEEEMKKLVILDRVTVCEALVVLIRVGADMGISQEEALKSCINHLEEGTKDPTFITKLLK